MDAQLKRGFLEACVLAAVNEEPSWGYRILHTVPEALELNESTLYPILRRLEQAGCLSVESAEHNGRLRKYYTITDLGRGRINDIIADERSIKAIFTFLHAKTKPPVTIFKGGRDHAQAGVS